MADNYEEPIENESTDSQGIDLTSKKTEQNEVERKELLSRVASGNIKTTKERVAFILNNSNEARNSDIDLAWDYWRYFEPDKFSGGSITKEQLRSLTRFTSLSRMRAKIQNEYNLFLADDEVRRFRGVLKEEISQDAVEDKPTGIGTYSVYIDETGKTQNYLSVGSLWVLDAGPSLITNQYELADWIKKQGVNFEFHFSELTDKKRVPVYKEFCSYFLSLFPTVGFKVITVNNKGFTDVNAAITDLTYHLINKGIAHENFTKRAPLPRYLQVWIDEDAPGSDSLKLENIQDRLVSQKIEGLYPETFEAISSKNNFLIQMADLFTGSVNRKLHNPGGTNYKDELADFILGNLGFDINDVDLQNSNADNAKLFSLR